MNVGSFGFSFGNIKIDVVGLNGEQATGSLTITSPIKDFTLKVKLHAGKNWSQLKNWNVEIDVTENEKPIPEDEPTDDEMGWEEREDGDDA